MNQRSIPDPLRVAGLPLWEWLSGPMAVLAVSVAQVVCGLFILAPAAAFPASAVRFLSMLGAAVGVGTILRLSAGPRFVGAAWMTALERTGLLERVAIPWWDVELPEAWLLERDSGWRRHRSVLLGLAMGIPLVATSLLTLTQAGLPRDVARLELVEGQTAEYLQDSDGQRRRLQGRLRLDEVQDHDGIMTAVLTGSDLSGTNERQTRLSEGDRVALGDWTVQLTAVAPATVVRGAAVLLDGQAVDLVAGTPVEVDGVSVELREGRFSFLGQLGPAALIRQTASDSTVVEEWVFVRAPSLHGGLGSGPLGVELIRVLPGTSIELTAVSGGSMWHGFGLLWMMLLVGLAGLMMLWGGRWVVGRDGDYTLVLWGVPTARRRLWGEVARLLSDRGVLTGARRRSGAGARLWWVVPVLATLLVGAMGPVSWLNPALWLAVASASHLLLVRDGWRESVVLLIAAGFVALALSLTGSAAVSSSRAWVLHSLALGSAAVLLVHVWAVSSRGGLERMVQAVVLMVSMLPLTYWTVPALFELRDSGGEVSLELSTWATNSALLVVQTPTSIASSDWAGLLVVVLLVLGAVATMVRTVWQLRMVAATAAAVAGGCAVWLGNLRVPAPTSLQGAPLDTGMQLVGHFRDHASESIVSAPAAAFVACAGLVSVAALLLSRPGGVPHPASEGAWSGVMWLSAATVLLVAIRHEALGASWSGVSPATGITVVFSGLLLLAAGARMAGRDRIAAAVLALAVSMGLQGMIVL